MGLFRVGGVADLVFRGVHLVGLEVVVDLPDVHDDLHLLAEYEVIHFEADGRVKRPYVPYDTVRIKVEVGYEDPPTPEP